MDGCDGFNDSIEVGTEIFVKEDDAYMKKQCQEALFFIDQLLTMIGTVKLCEIIRKEGLYVPNADLLLDYSTMRQNAQDFLNNSMEFVMPVGCTLGVPEMYIDEPKASMPRKIENVFIDKLNRLLDEAVYLMVEMLKFGEHEGRCDHLDNTEDSCTLHNAAFNKRRCSLEYFVNNADKIRQKI